MRGISSWPLGDPKYTRRHRPVASRNRIWAPASIHRSSPSIQIPIALDKRNRRTRTSSGLGCKGKGLLRPTRPPSQASSYGSTCSRPRRQIQALGQNRCHRWDWQQSRLPHQDKRRRSYVAQLPFHPYPTPKGLDVLLNAFRSQSWPNSEDRPFCHDDAAARNRSPSNPGRITSTSRRSSTKSPRPTQSLFTIIIYFKF